MLRRGTESLAEILGQRSPRLRLPESDLFSAEKIQAEGKVHKTFRLEIDDGLNVPNVIFPANGDDTDFFATLATYYQGQVPLSALVHILGRETVDLLSEKDLPVKSSVTQSTKASRLACIGAALGESALLGASNRGTDEYVSYAACRRTLSFSLCRASILYRSSFPKALLTSRWQRLRESTGLHVSGPAIEAAGMAHDLAMGNMKHLSGMPGVESIADATFAFVTSLGNEPGPMLDGLRALYPSIGPSLREMEGPFDGRMIVFTKLIDAIRAESRGAKTDDIAIGFLCDRIFPGSFAHYSLLIDLVMLFPAACVWYGFFAACSSQQSALNSNSTLFTKLDRDLIEVFSFEQRPRCDISFEEYDVLSRLKINADTVKPTNLRSVLVALLPGVDIYSRLSGSAEQSSDLPQRDVSEEIHRRVSMLLEEALYTLRKSDPTTRNFSRQSDRKRDRYK